MTFGESLTQGSVTDPGKSIMNDANKYSMGWGDMGTYGKMQVVGEGLGAFGALADMYTSFKSLKLAKKTRQDNIRQFNLGFNAQAQQYNNFLRSRHAVNAQAYDAMGRPYMSESEYMGNRQISQVGPNNTRNPGFGETDPAAASRHAYGNTPVAQGYRGIPQLKNTNTGFGETDPAAG
jgi:hypothetical protein